MAVTIVDTKLSGGGTAAASVTNTFDAQPSSGNIVIGCGGCWFMEGSSTLSYSAPASLTTLISAYSANPEMGGLLVYKSSSGSDGAAVTLDKSGTTRSMALLSLSLSGAGAPDAYGSNSPTADGTSISVTTNAGASSGSVTTDNSVAYFVVLRRARAETLTDVVYSNSFTEVDKRQSSSDSNTEIYVAKKTVNIADGTITCQWSSATATAAGLQAFLFVVPPTNTAPTITVPGAQRYVIGVPEVVSGLSMTDPDAGDKTLTCTCTKGTWTAPTPTGLDVTGSGTAVMTLTGTTSEINTYLGSGNGPAYTHSSANHDADTLTFNIDDGTATDEKTVAVTAIDARGTANTMEDLNGLISGFLIDESTEGTTNMTVRVTDDGGRYHEIVIPITVGAAISPSTGAASLIRSRRRRL